MTHVHWTPLVVLRSKVRTAARRANGQIYGKRVIIRRLVGPHGDPVAYEAAKAVNQRMRERGEFYEYDEYIRRRDVRRARFKERTPNRSTAPVTLPKLGG